MKPILQQALPPEMRATPGLPGVAPCGAGDWLRVDDAYSAQMAERARLLKGHRDEVLWMPPDSLPAAQEVLDQALAILPAMGFDVGAKTVRCPDGRIVPLNCDAPFVTLNALIQEDICILDKRGDTHALIAAVLCFPASWRLSEKMGQALIGIHEPVEEYDEMLARRVQRLFDGVKPGRPLWRFNRLWYEDATLHQPRSGGARRIEPSEDAAPFVRSERQCIVRMPRTGAVVFSIHTYVVNS